MAYDGTIPALSNLISNDIPAIQENFSLLASAQVVDEGSTADGDYIRYENGWQICTTQVELTYDNVTVLKGVITPPVSFVGNVIVLNKFTNFPTDTSVNNYDNLNYAYHNYNGNQEIYMRGDDLQSTDVIYQQVIMIGRWK